MDCPSCGTYLIGRDDPANAILDAPAATKLHVPEWLEQTFNRVREESP